METVEALTLDTTWQFQLWSESEQAWNWYSQAEYRTEEACHEAAETVYGGAFKGTPGCALHRIVRHDRTIVSFG
jgi:hypothetical protein